MSLVFPSAHSVVQQTRVLIADRNRMASQLLAESLERDTRFEVVAVPPPAEVLSEVITRKPDVAVISADFGFEPRKGLQVTRTLSACEPRVRIVILLDVPERELVIASFRSGARAVFCRTELISEFPSCVERVSRGEIWAHNIEADFLLQAVRCGPGCDAIGSDKVGTLSKREIDVAELAVQGRTNKQIAAQLGISEHTVKNYLFRIFEKLRVSNRMELFFFLSNHDKSAVSSPGECEATNSGHPLQDCLKAAEEGLIAAQYTLGVAHFEGCGVEQNEHAAYYWLRMTEENAFEFRECSRVLIEQLKAKIRLHDIEELERRVETQHGPRLSGKRTRDLLKQYTGSPKLAG